MDNHIFRSAALGFNRQDVMAYIEKTQKDAEANANALSRQLDEALNELADLRLKLEESTGESERLAGELEEVRQQYQEEHEAREILEQDAARQSGSIQSLTAERDRLDAQVRDFTDQSDSLRQEKEKLAQLELDAHRRADELLAQTQAEAELRLSEAQSRAEGLIAAAEARQDALLNEAREQVGSAAQQCDELVRAFEAVSSHITGELRKLSTTNGRLPAQLNDLRDGLNELQKKIG